MIQPNEKLLPGNVVMYHAHQGDAPVSLWARRILDIVSLETYQRNHSPIPLTPDILVLWCGFRQIAGFYEFHTDRFIFLFPMSIIGKLSIMDSYLDSINMKSPEHLHTLQNLIYFLSGEEMPVNIPNH